MLVPHDIYHLINKSRNMLMESLEAYRSSGHLLPPVLGLGPQVSKAGSSQRLLS